MFCIVPVPCSVCVSTYLLATTYMTIVLIAGLNGSFVWFLKTSSDTKACPSLRFLPLSRGLRTDLEM